jgi:hypothetical protein
MLSHFRIALTKSDVAEKWLGKGCSRMTIAAAAQLLLQQHSFKPRDFGKKAIRLAETLKNLNTSTDDRVGARQWSFCSFAAAIGRATEIPSAITQNRPLVIT